MSLPTWGWTDRHLTVGGLLLLAVTGSLVGLTEGTPVAEWVAAALGISALLALGFGVWGGALVGLAASAGVVLARKASDLWSPAVFGAALTETVVIVAVAVLAGYTGSRLRPRGAEMGESATAVAEYESLGLLSADGAIARLQEETARVHRHGWAVELALVDVHLTDESLPEAGRRAALRAVARVLESRTPELDVPFALGPDRFGIIFPEAVGGAAWDTISAVLEAVASAQFIFGSERQPRPLADAVELFVGLATHNNTRDPAQGLIDAATEALERARHEEVALR